MGIGNKLLDGTLSRRSFIQAGIGIAGAVSLSGCSKNDSEEQILLPSKDDAITPQKELKIINGSCSRACGSLCIIKAHVENGVIKRVTSDDIVDEDISKGAPYGRLQSRACLKCRSQRYYLNSSNRVIYPLYQTKERGDLTGFKRVSWTEAAKIYREATDRLRAKYGPGTCLDIGGGGSGGYGGFPLSLDAMLGGHVHTRQDFSQACWEHIENFVRPQRFTDFGTTWAPGYGEEINVREKRTGWIKGVSGYALAANAITDGFNSDQIILWSHNPSETIATHNFNIYLTRMREEGIKIMAVDQRYSPSVSAHVEDLNNFIAIYPNTDAAFVMAIIHELLTTYRADLRAKYGANNDAELKTEIERWIYGLFDNENPTTYNSADTLKHQVFPNDFPMITDADFKSLYKVPAGASFSAYIMGDNDALVTAGFNLATSIYPHKIGYNVRSYEYEGEGADPLTGKYAPCYGHVEKTPEWAEKICGVPADKIRSFTRQLVTGGKTSIWTGFGLQRHHEAEQTTWSLLILGTLLRCFGAKGESTGGPRAPGFILGFDFLNYAKFMPALNFPWNMPNSTSILNQIYGYMKVVDPVNGYLNMKTAIDYEGLGFFDKDKLSFPALTDDYTRTCIPVKEVFDAIGATNRAKVKTKTLRKVGGNWELKEESVYPSLWNDGQVQRLPRPITYLVGAGGNKLCSNGADVNRTVRELLAKNDTSGHPKKYRVEFVLTYDIVMTGTARYADLVLPAATNMEKFVAPLNYTCDETILPASFKATEPPGDAKCEIDGMFELYKGWLDNPADETTFKQLYYGGSELGACIGDENMSGEEKALKAMWESNRIVDKGDRTDIGKGEATTGEIKPVHEPIQRPFTYEEFKKRGVAYAGEYAYNYRTIPEKLEDFIPADPSRDVFIWNQEFRERPQNYPMHTPSGRVEAFCQAMVEDYEGRNFHNYDDNITIGGSLKFAGTPANWETKGRYVYPIPMYIPALESRHACDDSNAPATDTSNPLEAVTGYTKHPDPLGLYAKGYNYTYCNFHPIFRAHTMHDTTPVINELFKKNSKGEPAFYNFRTAVNQSSISQEAAKEGYVNVPPQMTDGVYEMALLGEGSTYSDGSVIQNGDLIVIESLRGKGVYSARISKRIRKGTVSVAQGSHYQNVTHDGNPESLDIGGSTGTHISQRPSRFGRGFTASDIRVKITKKA